MSNSLNGYCGTVSQSGQITSNGNFSCQTETGVYTLDYNGACTNPVPVVSLTSSTPGLTYVLNVYTSGFKLYVYDRNLVPVQSSFNFIVAEIV